MFHRNTSSYTKNYPFGKKKFGKAKRLSKSKSQQKSKIKVLIIILIVGLFGVFLLAGLYLVLLVSSSQKEVTATPLMFLEITSTPSGATVLLQGKEKGVTPLKLPISAGTQILEFRKSGYASYFRELKVENSSQVTASKTGSFPISQTAGVITKSNSISSTGLTTSSPITLPAFSLKVDLWPAQVQFRSLPKPLPATRLEYARYLNSEDIELTYLTVQGMTQAPGSEGLPTNLWVYHPASIEQPRPVLLSYPTLQSIARYSGSITDTDTDTSTTFLGEMAISGPIIAPEAGRIAYISNRVTKNITNKTALQKDGNQTMTLPIWDDQAIWISELGEKPSAGGAILTETKIGVDGRPFSPLFSLKDLPGLFPGLVLPANNSISNSYTGQRFATIQQLSWSPKGDKLVATIEINKAFLAGGNTGSSNSAVTIMVLLTTAGSAKEGKAVIVTPQPLSNEVLPGTFVWNSDETAVSFLVNSSQNAPNSNAQAALCILDLKLGSEFTAQPGTQNTPLHYLSQINSADVWNSVNQTPSFNMLHNLTGGQILPNVYGSMRYNPFSWFLTDPTQEQPNLSALGLYSAPGQQSLGNSTSNQLNIHNLYFYSGTTAVSKLVPFLTATPSNSTKSANILQVQPKNGSYPYWQIEHSPIYLAIRPITDEKDKTGQSSGLLGGSSNLTWQLSVETFSLRGAFDVSLPESEKITNIPGITLTWLNEQRNSTVLVLPNSGTKAIGGLAPGKLEAEWQPDGKGVLIALPPTSGGSSSYQDNNLWLATWE